MALTVVFPLISFNFFISFVINLFSLFHRKAKEAMSILLKVGQNQHHFSLLSRIWKRHFLLGSPSCLKVCPTIATQQALYCSSWEFPSGFWPLVPVRIVSSGPSARKVIAVCYVARISVQWGQPIREWCYCLCASWRSPCWLRRLSYAPVVPDNLYQYYVDLLNESLSLCFVETAWRFVGSCFLSPQRHYSDSRAHLPSWQSWRQNCCWFASSQESPICSLS